MNNARNVFIAIIMIAALAFTPYANADNLGKIIGKGVASSRMGGMLNSGRGIRTLSGLSQNRSHGSGLTNLSRGLSQLQGNRGNNLENLSRGLSQLQSRNGSGRLDTNRESWNNSDLGNLIRNYSDHAGNGYNGGYNNGWNNPYHHESNAMSKAYRDVGIANAVVGLIGIMVNASQTTNYRTNTATPAPAGYWERQAVIVQPKSYEQYQEWIPELFDPNTGQKLGGGYYETRTRILPEVVEHRDVWVTR